MFATQNLKSPSQEMPPAVPNLLNLTQPTPEPRIVHPGVVICMLQLLPSVYHTIEVEKALHLQIYLAEVIKSLVRR